MSRDAGYYWIRILVYTVLSICVGTVFYDVGASTGYTAIMSRVNCGGFITGFMTIMAVGGFPSFIEEIKGIMMLASGYYRSLDDIPKPFLRYPISYISFMAWAVQGVYKNLLLGLEFDPIIPGTPKLKGEVVLRTMLGIPLSHSKWWDLTAILVIFISYRLLFLVIAKLKERASPLFWTLHANKILQHLDKKSSVKKKPSCPSKRHHPPHSLSSQEGLSSPLA